MIRILLVKGRRGAGAEALGPRWALRAATKWGARRTSGGVWLAARGVAVDVAAALGGGWRRGQRQVAEEERAGAEIEEGEG